jgi:hypothetical protein
MNQIAAIHSTTLVMWTTQVGIESACMMSILQIAKEQEYRLKSRKV